MTPRHKAIRPELTREFIEAGLYRLTGHETPGIGKCVPYPQSEVYSALCSAADKLTRDELRVLAAAFDNLSANGSPLVATEKVSRHLTEMTND